MTSTCWMPFITNELILLNLMCLETNYFSCLPATASRTTADGKPSLCFCWCGPGSGSSGTNRPSAGVIRGRSSGEERGPWWFAYVYYCSVPHLLVKPEFDYLELTRFSYICYAIFKAHGFNSLTWAVTKATGESISLGESDRLLTWQPLPDR